MWLKKVHPGAGCIMVEPEMDFLNSGKNNFYVNGYDGEFINQFVSNDGFKLDSFAKERNLPKIDILHTDIQGFEVEMLNGAKSLLAQQSVDYIFISTHSNELHDAVQKQLVEYNYRIEVSSSFSTQTTSHDGLIFATSPQIGALFEKFSPLGRLDIANSQPIDLISSIIKSV